MMRAHYFQHVPFEGLGSIESWMKSNGFEITSSKFYESVDIPDPQEIDILIILGGPMSVHDEALYPWLAKEKQFVKDVIGLGKSVLGICLGAQIIAQALGAEIVQNSLKEIGWFPIYAVDSSDKSAFAFPHTALVFHWHGETFNLPQSSIRLASSAACSNQAFQFGKSVIGLQFHLETTKESVEAMLSNCGDELIAGTYIQSAQELLSVPQEHYSRINNLMNEVLEYIRPV
jgi:GMP synthase-like glutamine amidotransferase